MSRFAPTLVFVVVGALLFGLNALREPSAEPDRASASDTAAVSLEIVIEPERVQKLAKRYAAARGTAPSAVQLEALVQGWVAEEILHREAVTLGLHYEDAAVRKQLIARFIQLMSADAEPTPAELQALLTQQPERYRQPATLDIEQVFHKRGHPAEAPAASLAALRDGVDPSSLGDGFAHGRRLSRLSARKLRQLLGAKLAALAFESTGSEWLGPVSSGYGTHIFRVTKRTPGAPGTVQTARKQLFEAWRRAARSPARIAARYRSRYHIVRAPRR